MGLLDEAIREHLELKRLRGADPADVARMEREALGPARRPDSEAAASAETVPGAAIPFDAELDQPGAAGAAAVAEPGEHGASGDEYDVPASGLQGEVPPSAMYDAEEDAPAASEPADRSIEQASYGQETAEFDVESAVLGHEAAEPDLFGEEAGGGSDPASAPGPHAPDVAQEPPLAPPPSPDEPGPYGAVVDQPTHDPDAPAGDDRAEYVEEPTQLHPQAPGAGEEAAQAPPTPPDVPEHPTPAPARGPGEAGADPEAEEDVLEETPDFLQETPEHERLWFEQRPPRDFDFDK